MKFFLIGFMGAGKSTIGKFAARRNDFTFLDLDSYVEKIASQEVADIFQEVGERGFREIERRALEEVLALEGDYIISCGGGTPCFFDNISLMNQAGFTLYLDLSSARLTDRLRNAKSKRPLIANLKGDLQIYVHKKLLERAEFYAEAKVIVPEYMCNKKDVSELITWMIAESKIS